MPSVPSGQHHLSYQVLGEGPPLVMLRGLARSTSHWLGYDKVMAKHCKVITIDSRGIGTTTRPLSITDSLFDLADDVIAVLDKLNINQAHILGVSLGGMVTLATGIKYPERCRSLITLNTSVGRQKTVRITPAAIWAIAQGLISTDKEKIHKNLADILTASNLPLAKKQKAAEQFWIIAEREGLYVSTALKQLLLAARFDIRKHLDKLTMPVLLVYGEDDRFVPKINTLKIKNLLPNARLLGIEAAGHEITMDQPHILRSSITSWLDEHPITLPTPSNLVVGK